MWSLDQEEDYFRIYDSKKQIAGYLDPDYEGAQRGEEKEIEDMLKDKDPVPGCFVMFPMVKFDIFSNEGIGVDSLKERLSMAIKRVTAWRDFLEEIKMPPHSIQTSHTDQDMLSITISIVFDRPTRLQKDELLDQVKPILNRLQELHLL